MQTSDAQAAVVDATELRDGLTTTIARADVEEALRLDEPPELVLDVARPGGDARFVAVSWKRDDLERLLREATGDTIELTFDRSAIVQALDDDVEAHGLREKAAILAVAITAAGGLAGTASAMQLSPGGGGTPTGAYDPTDGGIVDPVTGVKFVTERAASDEASSYDMGPAAAAVGGAAALAIAGAAFAVRGRRRLQPT